PAQGSVEGRVMNRSGDVNQLEEGVELALGRALFPVAVLRAMGWIAGEDTSWTQADPDIPDCEPLLVELWKKATGGCGRRRFLGSRDLIAQAAMRLAEAAFEYLADPIGAWWHAAGEPDAQITTALALGVRFATQAQFIGRLAAGAAIQVLEE